MGSPILKAPETKRGSLLLCYSFVPVPVPVSCAGGREGCSSRPTNEETCLDNLTRFSELLWKARIGSSLFLEQEF